MYRETECEEINEGICERIVFEVDDKIDGTCTVTTLCPEKGNWLALEEIRDLYKSIPKSGIRPGPWMLI